MKNPFLVFPLAMCALVSCAQDRPSNARAETSENISSPINATAGRKLFLKNCVHCHGTDVRGDDGPDLHKLDDTDDQIATRIRNGKKGQMTAFAGKLTTNEINALIVYLRTLK